MTDSIQLRGITWNHTRGYLPVVATAQRYSETHPQVEIIWEKRSLQAFADYPIENLIERYDLLVIDHPWAGFAARSHVLLPLQDYVQANFMNDQAANSVGKSHESYTFDGYHCAFAIDAATPVASYRADLLEQAGRSVPVTWDDLLDLARSGLVVVPAIPIDTLMNFYMLCSTLGTGPFQDGEYQVSRQVGTQALEMLRELLSLCSPEVWQLNPIAVYEALSSRDDLAYCPFAYGYSNYARPGYARHTLTFADLVTLGTHGHCKTTLGGTGLAISARCPHREVALDYACYVASPECQRTLYFESGGQPGYRAAWLDPEVNRRSNNFFSATLPALDRAYLRPRYDGYLHFQDHAGAIVQNYARNGGNPAQVLDRLEVLYRESKERGVHETA